MVVSKSACLVLGAVFGVVTVYVAPCFISEIWSDKKRKKINPDVQITEENSKKEIVGNTSSTMCSILEKVVAEISRLCDNVIRNGDISDSSSIYKDARSHSTPSSKLNNKISSTTSCDQIYRDARNHSQMSIDLNISQDIEGNDQSTQYKKLGKDILKNYSNKDNLKEKMHELHEEIIQLSILERDSHQQILQNSKERTEESKKNIFVPIGKDTLELLEELAVNSRNQNNSNSINNKHIINLKKYKNSISNIIQYFRKKKNEKFGSKNITETSEISISNNRVDDNIHKYSKNLLL